MTWTPPEGRPKSVEDAVTTALGAVVAATAHREMDAVTEVYEWLVAYLLSREENVRRTMRRSVAAVEVARERWQ